MSSPEQKSLNNKQLDNPAFFRHQMGITAYLVILALADCILLVLTKQGLMPAWWNAFNKISLCALVGGIGGVVYCSRAVYYHACEKRDWNPQWHIWYYIRPFISHLCGAISFLFLKAGLIILESETNKGATELGFLALAFVAGYNVDKFVAKIEDVASIVWGIEKSRRRTEEEANKKPVAQDE